MKPNKNNNKGKMFALFTVALFVLALVPAALSKGGSDDDQLIDSSELAVTQEQARAIAAANFGGTISEMKLDAEDGRIVWEVELIEGGLKHEIKIDARTEDIVKRETEPFTGLDIDDDLAGIVGDLKISADQARAIALADANGVVHEIKLDDENGMIVWEVEIVEGNLKHEIKIDANTGAIVKRQTEAFNGVLGLDANLAALSADFEISMEQARAIALANANGVITEIKVDMENGMTVWEIELMDGDLRHEVKIDVSSGNVVKLETKDMAKNLDLSDDFDDDNSGRGRGGDDNLLDDSDNRDNSGPGSGDEVRAEVRIRGDNAEDRGAVARFFASILSIFGL